MRAPLESLEERRADFARRLSEIRYYQGRSTQAATPLADLYEKRSRLESPRAKALRPGFRTPVSSDAITIVGAPLDTGKGLTVLSASQWQRLHLSRVKLLAATPPVLRQVVACVECSLLAMPRLSDAIVVFNTVEQGILQSGEREMLWRCFGLPVYEQWLGLEGELLAWECEAHQGLHVNESALEWELRGGQILASSLVARRCVTRNLETGWAAEVDTRPCLCSETSPRFLRLRAWQPAGALAVA
jgi:hypothetical protein